MLQATAEQTISRIATNALAVAPLAGALRSPPRIAPVLTGQEGEHTSACCDADIGAILNRITMQFGITPILWRPDEVEQFTSFENVISRYLSVDPRDPGLSSLGVTMDSLIDRVVGEVRQNCLEATFPCVRITTVDGTVLRAYAGGKAGRPPVVLASACGMPVQLCERWLRFFAKEHFVVTWETRGMFNGAAHPHVMDCSLEAQAADLLAVIDEFQIPQAHLMGVCGGAAIALVAAAKQPDRFNSLSLWHGDFNFGPDCPKTLHQRDLVDLMHTAGKSLTSAASLQRLFQNRSALTSSHTAHLALYPYANESLLYWYGRLNGAIMTADIESLLDNVMHATLVVTSEDDDTAHPDGSRHVANRLAHATLRVRPHGDHLSAFDAEPSLTDLVQRFVQQYSPPLTPALAQHTGRTMSASKHAPLG